MQRVRTPIAVVALIFLLAGCGGEAKKASRTDPTAGPMGKLRLAQSYLRAGRGGDALDAATEAVEQAPDDAAVRHGFGQICFLLGRLDLAEEAFLRTLELDPYRTDAHNFLGAVYDQTGRKDEAEREYRKALEDPAYPNPENVYLNLGLLYGSQGRDEEGISALRRAVEIEPKFYRAHFELASLLDRTERLEEALREYEVAEPGFRNDGTFYFRLGMAYLRLGRAEEARVHLARVLELSPGSENAARAGEILRMVP